MRLAKFTAVAAILFGVAGTESFAANANSNTNSANSGNGGNSATNSGNGPAASSSSAHGGSGYHGSPVNQWVKQQVLDDTTTNRGYWHSLIGAGNSLNHNPNADPADASRISRIERYFDAAATAAPLAALADSLLADALAAAAVVGPPAATLAELQAIADGGFVGLDPAQETAIQVYLDAKALADAAETAAIAAFTEADNRPYDVERRSAYDSLWVILAGP